jgi:hypothetical protein
MPEYFREFSANSPSNRAPSENPVFACVVCEQDRCVLQIVFVTDTTQWRTRRQFVHADRPERALRHVRREELPERRTPSGHANSNAPGGATSARVKAGSA